MGLMRYVPVCNTSGWLVGWLGSRRLDLSAVGWIDCHHELDASDGVSRIYFRHGFCFVSVAWSGCLSGVVDWLIGSIVVNC